MSRPTRRCRADVPAVAGLLLTGRKAGRTAAAAPAVATAASAAAAGGCGPCGAACMAPTAYLEPLASSFQHRCDSECLSALVAGNGNASLRSAGCDMSGSGRRRRGSRLGSRGTTLAARTAAQLAGLKHPPMREWCHSCCLHRPGRASPPCVELESQCSLVLALGRRPQLTNISCTCVHVVRGGSRQWPRGGCWSCRRSRRCRRSGDVGRRRSPAPPRSFRGVSATHQAGAVRDVRHSRGAGAAAAAASGAAAGRGQRRRGGAAPRAAAGRRACSRSRSSCAHHLPQACSDRKAGAATLCSSRRASCR